MANILLKKFKTFFVTLFKKTKKVAQLPQGEEYENWLGV
jgi:hypothetical protein